MMPERASLEQEPERQALAATLEVLLARNDERFRAFVEGRFCRLIQDGTLERVEERDTFLACLQLFSRRMQALFFTRQALCADSRFYGVFLKHLQEEIGHDGLLARRQGAWEMRDSVLDATLCWFLYQMVVLDNIERATIVHLVLEKAGDYAHNLMAPALSRHLDSDFMQVHAELDPAHAAMGLPLLSNHHSLVYGRLCALVDDAWDMLHAVTNRIVELVQGAGVHAAGPT